jgi:UDP-GlcNAc:undecaprenyl-phosphate/decaprenyl-phosphate GlcNAc-1-phosphate transferase
VNVSELASETMNNATPVIFAIAILVTYLLCRNAMVVATAVGVLDIPDERKKHKHITPLMGGLALLCAFVPSAMAVIMIATPPNHHFKLLLWLTVVAGMTVVGILDDRHSLSPKLRLILSFLIFGLAAYVEPMYNVRVLDFEHPPFTIGLGTRGLAIAFTVLCCVGLINAVNMADGKNGLVIGLCIGWLVLLALRAPTPFLPLISLLIATLIVLLAFNLKGKLFLGDGGAYGLAAAIGVLAIAIYNSPGPHATRALAAEELVVLFAVPVFDSFRLTYKRMKRGQSPMAADRNHLHHILLDGFGWPRGLLIYWTAATAPAAAIFLFL